METKLEEALSDEQPVETPVEDIAPVAADEPPEQSEEVAPTEAEEAPEAPQVPLAALLAERDDSKAMKAELDQLKVQFRQLQQPPQEAEEPAKVPDVFEQPEEYTKYMEGKIDQTAQQVQQTIFNERLNMSERFAVQNHGAETVEQVKAWFTQRAETDPNWAQSVLSQPDPYDHATRQYQQEQTQRQLAGIDPDELKAAIAIVNGERAPASTPALPKTTASDRTVGARKGPEWAGTTPLESILDE